MDSHGNRVREKEGARMNIHTKEEAISRAKAWLVKQGVTTLPCRVSADAPLLVIPGNGGGCGGYILIVNRGADDEGTVVAVTDYNADLKKFRWKEPEER